MFTVAEAKRLTGGARLETGVCKMALKFKRIYVRRYTDTGQITAYADHDKGRTEATCRYEGTRRRGFLPAFGPPMHALFAAAKAQGLRLERETW